MASKKTNDDDRDGGVAKDEGETPTLSLILERLQDALFEEYRLDMPKFDDEDSDDDEVLGDWFEQDDFVAYEPKATPKNEEVPKTPVESCEFFLKFPEAYRKQLIGVMDKIIFNDGDEIIKQGRSSNRMYVITEGEAVVTKKGTKEGEADVEITHLYAGGYFGEMSLLFDGKLDEVAIFNRALSGPKIKQIYDATAVVSGEVKTANLFTGGLDTSLVYWNRMGDS